MAENFKKVVNLQSRPSNNTKERSQFERSSFATPLKKMKSRAEEIDRVYSDENNTGSDKKDMAKIDRPTDRSRQTNIFKTLLVVLILVLIVLATLNYLKSRKSNTPSEKNTTETVKNEGNWYSVQLTSGEVYYGFIKDTGADPIVLENVFYNYDQINKTEVDPTADKQNNSIRLVKRGKESHGPDGTMSVVRAQALFMEPLSEDSKILKAILEYEKQ